MTNEQSKKDGSQLFSVDDSEIDPQQIMAEIESQIMDKNPNLAAEKIDVPSFSPGTYPQKPDDIPYDLTLYQLMDDLKRDYRQTGVEWEMKDSGLTRLPFIGRLWSEMRRLIHGPAHFYTNRSADKQANINGQIWEIISKLITANQQQLREIRRLERQVRQGQDGDRIG